MSVPSTKGVSSPVTWAGVTEILNSMFHFIVMSFSLHLNSLIWSVAIVLDSTILGAVDSKQVTDGDIPSGEKSGRDAGAGGCNLK